jgi:hypothetical protein
MMTYGEVDAEIHVSFTSKLVGGVWSASRPDRFTPGERAPGTHWIGSWVDLRAGLDDVENRKFFTLSGLELRPLGRPARSQSLSHIWYTYFSRQLVIGKEDDRKQFLFTFIQVLSWLADDGIVGISYEYEQVMTGINDTEMYAKAVRIAVCFFTFFA